MNELNELINEFNNIFNTKNDGVALKSDVIEYKDGYMVLTDIPGVNKELIKLSYDNDTLSIKVDYKKEDDSNVYKLKERGRAFLEKEIYFTDVDFQNAQAQYENGVLRLYIPKTQKKCKNIVIE